MQGVFKIVAPTLAILVGIFWFRRKKKPPAVEGEPSKSQGEGDRIVVLTSDPIVTSPVVYVTQPSQPTPKEAITKAVAYSMPEALEAESDSEEESIESVVTAIEASNTGQSKPADSDVGVIEDACPSSGLFKKKKKNDASCSFENPAPTPHPHKIPPHKCVGCNDLLLRSLPFPGTELAGFTSAAKHHHKHVARTHFPSVYFFQDWFLWA